MRIISGYFKGKKLLQPNDRNTRPLKDLAKESIFNVLSHSNKFSFELKNSNILDLFSGIGSFGLEALSREAGFVSFVENYSNVTKILKKNINNLNQSRKSEIIEKDIFKDLNFNNLNRKYDLVFIDPPFKEEKVNKLLYEIFKAKVLNSKGIIIIHRKSRESHIFPKEIIIKDKKTYGISQIFFCNFQE